jgi:hypothetical protein
MRELIPPNTPPPEDAGFLSSGFAPLDGLPDEPGVLGRLPKLLPELPLAPDDPLPDEPGVPGRLPKLLPELPDDPPDGLLPEPGVLGRLPKLLPDPPDGLLPPDDPGVLGRLPKLLPELPDEPLDGLPLPDPPKREPDAPLPKLLPDPPDGLLPPDDPGVLGRLPKLLPELPDEPLPDDPDEPKREGDEPPELLGLLGPLPGRFGPVDPGRREAEDGPPLAVPLPDILVRPALEPGKFEAGRFVKGFTRD